MLSRFERSKAKRQTSKHHLCFGSSLAIRNHAPKFRKRQHANHGFVSQSNTIRYSSWLSCVYHVIDARGILGEHKRSVSVTRGEVDFPKCLHDMNITYINRNLFLLKHWVLSAKEKLLVCTLIKRRILLNHFPIFYWFNATHELIEAKIR